MDARMTFLDDASGGTPSDSTARILRDGYNDSPGKLMAFAEEGHLPKSVLAQLLDIDSRQAYFDACAVIEKKYRGLHRHERPVP